MEHKVIAAGHICLDITPVFPLENKQPFTKLLAPGKLIHMNAADVSTGGSVANTGLAMRFFGMDVQLAGKVGNDVFGGMIAEILRMHGSSDGLIVDENGTTSYSVVLAPPGVDRIFLHHPGANDTFCSADITDEMLQGAELLHFGYPPLMQRMIADEGKELADLMQRAKQAGCKTSLDMAAVDPNSTAGKADWIAILKNALPYVDYFLPSVEELGFMLNRSLYAEWQARANGKDITRFLNIQSDVAPLAEILYAMGAKTVVIKCGAPGLYWSNGEKSGFERSYYINKVLSGTGAGDTSIAAFLTAMLQEKPIEQCIQLAVATGACCVEAYDALSGLRPFEELEAKIANGWEKEFLLQGDTNAR